MALKGINLGGWLVAERWMTHSLFDGVAGEGERELGRQLGMDEAKERLDQHRDTFITGQDIADIRSNGFDFVRVPVGYWLFEEDDGYVSGEHHLENLFEWADQHDIGVLIDFHGLQGSQNGNDHSGEVGRVNFYETENIERALRTVGHIATRYGGQDQLLGIGVINEPKIQIRTFGALLDYYKRSYGLIDTSTPEAVKVVVGDGFRPDKVGRAMARLSLGGRLVVDTHHYQLFSAQDERLSLGQHLQKAARQRKAVEDLANTSRAKVMIGEWTSELPDRIRREPHLEAARRAFLKAQEEAFDGAWAHCYWSYKAPDSFGWSYRDQFFK